MNWILANPNTLIETQSGFIIRLKSGSWNNANQVQIIPSKPMSSAKKVNMLCSGLAFVDSNAGAFASIMPQLPKSSQTQLQFTTGSNIVSLAEYRYKTAM